VNQVVTSFVEHRPRHGDLAHDGHPTHGSGGKTLCGTPICGIQARQHTRFCRHALLVWLLVLLVIVFAPLGAAQAAGLSSGPIWLVSSRDEGDYQQAATAFTQRLAAAQSPQTEIVFLDAKSTPVLPELGKDQVRPALIVAIGSPAVRLVQPAPADVPVLEVLIPRLLFEELHGTNGQGHRRSAVYIDQPFARQLNLCKLIIADLHRIAVLYGPASQSSAGALQAAAHRAGIELISQRLSAGSNPNAALDEVLDTTQLLLALPDTEVFNRYTVAGLLLTAYHHDIPVIGFSRAYVNAGALAAVYSSAAQIGRDAADMALAAHAADWNLPAPRYPASFSVAVNRQVAQSLGLKLREEDDLQQALVRQEETTP